MIAETIAGRATERIAERATERVTAKAGSRTRKAGAFRARLSSAFRSVSRAALWTARHGVRSHAVPVAVVGAPATDLGSARLRHRLDTSAGPITIRLEMPGAFPSPRHR